jgi:hypothetical protein
VTERTSHLAGLWIGAAISDTSHSKNKAGSTTVKTSTAHRRRIKVDGSAATISIKNFLIGLHVTYLYFQDTPRMRTLHEREVEDLPMGDQEAAR